MSGLGEAKAFLEERFPKAYGGLQQLRYRLALRRAFARVISAHRLVVQRGPFEGLTYPPQVATPERLISHALLPKLLGCYEEELHEVVADLRRNKYTRILNIGCAEGYYAVGFARGDAEVPVFAFDTDPGARKLCAVMARSNGVSDRITLRAECTTEELRGLASERALVICDCEGCERYLFGPSIVPYLRTSDLIIELHDCVDPTISRTLPKPFSATHDVEIIRRTKRDPAAYPPLDGLSAYRQALAVNEFRWGTILWGVFRAKAT